MVEGWSIYYIIAYKISFIDIMISYMYLFAIYLHKYYMKS